MAPAAIPLPPLNVPPSDTTVKVSVIESSGRLARVPATSFFDPHIEGFDFWSAPSYSFLIEHGPSDKLLFDLGVRKDPENYPPEVQKVIEGWILSADKNVSDVLIENGVDLSDIRNIVLSHRHFDHQGDLSAFPPSTNLIVGLGFKEFVGEGYPKDEKSVCLSDSWEGRKLLELDFESDKRATKIGRFQAIDFFDDGSFYLLRSLGHTIDHISSFARTKLAAQSTTRKDEFILMGGDVAHHAGEFKPNGFTPIPTEISPDPRLAVFNRSFCPGELYAELNKRNDGDDRWKKPFLTSAKGFLDDAEKAAWSLDVVGEFEAHDNVFVVFAHDAKLLDIMEFYPKSATDWKEKGWKWESRWRFLGDFGGK
ncbi:hypothetical protein M426DRAFT_64957 [Hypoxylon sp. CI-4A]|nr:hypothetical protein M426DRAFT_64957 [Hypoxylon sp. CI-4A]